MGPGHSPVPGPATGGFPNDGPRRNGPPAWLLVALGLVAVVVAGGALILVLQSTRSDGDSTASSGVPGSTDSSVANTAPSSSPSTSAVTIPPTTPATLPPTTPVQGVVSRTCGSKGNGDCFLSVRSSPDADARELFRLSEDDEIVITCTTEGESVLSSILGRRTTVWARTDQGAWVSMAFVDAPGFDPFTDSRPC